MKKALIVWGGWDGHQPKEVAEIFRGQLVEEGFEVEVSDTLEAFADGAKLKGLDLIVPVWTMGRIEQDWVNNVSAAVQSGVGLAGCHGGMCDSFRDNTDWQFMTGGQWIAHPGNDGTEHKVEIKAGSSPLVEGIDDFVVSTEQYYLHVDPANEVLATTRFPLAPGPHSTNKAVDMPVVWTKRWGQGRVYYNSLGHQANIMEIPVVKELMRRGFNWCAEGKALAKADESQEAYTGMQDNQL